MSEVLRDLVVSLSLDGDNFSRNLTSINKQIQEAESEFKRAAAGVDGFEKSISGAQSKLSSLQQKLTLQQRAVSQYQKALEAANKKLENCNTRQSKLTESLEKARQKHADLKKQVCEATKQYERFSRELGESDSATIAAKANMDALAQEYEESSAEVKKLEGQLTANTKSLRNNADAVTKTRTGLNQAEAALRETEAQIRENTEQLARMQSAWTKAGDSLTAFGTKCASVSASMSRIGKDMTMYMTTPVLALGTASVKASMEFESAFASVRKTVDATEEEYESLSASVKQMSTEIATSSSTIAEVMANAGQLGIQKDYLVDFTRTMIDLGNSTDISADEAATAIAQFANVTRMAQTDFGRFGSALVDLGNNFATTESAIMNMATRLAAAGSQVGLTQPQILGFATALSSVGLEAEAGGTAFSKAMIQMQVAVETGNDSLKDFAKVAGMTTDEFKAMWKSDPAGAIEAFIVGLSKMDEQGISAIATLEEMGLTEVRLRDTLLRATNATELFSEAQETANEAWEENVALSNEASKRYATTESKLKNLKNTAILAAQRIGDDLNPTIQNLIDGAKDLLEKFMALDEEQRLMIIKLAAIAAAAGPTITVFSKIVKVVGSVSTGFGKFATSVASAGGGWKGFMSVLGKSPATWLAVAAAVVTATIAIADYVSGAKQAREALKGMQETADAWKDTAAETFYGSSEGLSAFGLTAEDFTRNQQAAEDWLSGLLTVWTDGQKETDEIVSEWTESFKSLTAATREELKEMQATAQQGGYTSVADQLAADIAQLDAMDKEIESLLKKRQSKLFTEKDKIRLQELIDAREAIEVKYNLSPADTDGFAKIRQQMEAEIARAQAAGKSDADVSVYEDAMVAAAEGMAAVNAQIDAQYDKEFQLIQLITDSTERQVALDDLNVRYNAQRQAAALEYAETMASVVMPVWNQPDIQAAATDIDTLTQKLREYSAANESEKPQLLEDLNEITSTMDEGAITEYIALLMQVQSLLDSGMSEADVQSLFPELDFSGAMDQIASIKTFLSNHENLLPGLDDMFSEAIPEEVLTIATDLDMTGAQERWTEFAANPGAITTEAIVTGFTQQEGVEPPKLETQVAITGYDLIAYRQFITDNPVEVEGILRLGEVYTDPEAALSDENVTFWKDGVEIPATLVPKELLTPDKVAVLDEDGTMHILITTEVTGSEEAIETLRQEVAEVDQLGVTALGMAAGIQPSTTLDFIDAAIERIRTFNNEKGTFWQLWGLLEDGAKNTLDTSMQLDFSPERLASLSTYVAEVVSAISQGKEVSEDDIAALQKVLTFVEELDSTEVGNNVILGIADGMTAAGWDSDAETVAANLESAINLALGIQSPSTRMKPSGENVAAGIGAGMTGYDLSTDAATMATNLETAVSNALTATTLTSAGTTAVEGLASGVTSYSMSSVGQSVASALKSAVTTNLTSTTLKSAGVNAMAGLKAGINSGKSGVVSAMRTAAKAAVNAAKSALKIASPSGVFRDEVGVMTMRGFGEGVLQESKEQAKVISNAARYLTTAAQGGIGSASYDNRRTYNQNTTSTIQVDKLYVRDEQDIRSLAVEIATLTRRQQRGKGMRLA
jgi:TP901 family phage tail tape measure protein